MQKVPFAMSGSVFEIREYLDEEGKDAGRGEVVDLQKELQQLEGIIGAKQQQDKDKVSDEKSKALGELAQKMRQMSTELSGAETEAEGGTSVLVEGDEDATFVRELQTLQTLQQRQDQFDGVVVGGLEFLDRLCAAEAEAVTAKVHERSAISSSGWGKGFFGGAKPKSKAATTLAPVVMPAAPEVVPPPAPAVTAPAAAAAAFTVGIVEKGF